MNRFMPYLTRGLWPFLAGFCVMLPVIFVGIFVAIVAAGILSAVSDPKEGPGPFFWVVMVVLMMLVVITMILVSLILVPVQLWAGLAQDFKPGKMFAFTKEFFGSVQVELILSQIFNVVIGLILVMVGALMCCLPAFPAQALVSYAQAHLSYQLYELYLQRGGAEIPLKVEEIVRPV